MTNQLGEINWCFRSGKACGVPPSTLKAYVRIRAAVGTVTAVRELAIQGARSSQRQVCLLHMLHVC